MAVTCDCHWIMQWNSLNAWTQVWNKKRWKDVTIPPKLFKEMTIAKSTASSLYSPLVWSHHKNGWLEPERCAHDRSARETLPALGRLPGCSAGFFEGLMPWRLLFPPSSSLRDVSDVFWSWKDLAKGLSFQREPECHTAAAVPLFPEVLLCPCPQRSWCPLSASHLWQSSSSSFWQLGNASHMAQGSRQWHLSLPKGKDSGWELHWGVCHRVATTKPISVSLCCKAELVPWAGILSSLNNFWKNTY